MKEIIYNITQQTEGTIVTFRVDEVFSKDSILGIINKTQSKVLYTPVQAANIADVTYNEGTLTILLSDNVPVILAGDELFIKLYSENEEKIDTTKLAKEQTLIDKATELAKQGDNQDATNTAILEAVSNIVDTKNLYSVRFERNDDGPNTYTMVLPVVAGVVGDTIIL